MRRYRAVEGAALALLLVAIACNPKPSETPLSGTPAPAPAPSSTINIIVSPTSLSGIVAHAGDTLQWQVLNPTDPGFTVSFPLAQTYKCGSNDPLAVSYRDPKSCTLSGGSGSGEVHFRYQITMNSASALKKGGSPPQSPPAPSGPIIFSVIPCKGCATISLAGQVHPGVTGPSDTGFISCSNGSLNVGQVGPNEDGNVTWDSSAGSWTVSFQQGKNPCKVDSEFANNTSPYSSVCSVDPSKKGPYSYDATLDTPAPGCKGTGTLITGK